MWLGGLVGIFIISTTQRHLGGVSRTSAHHPLAPCSVSGRSWPQKPTPVDMGAASVDARTMGFLAPPPTITITKEKFQGAKQHPAHTTITTHPIHHSPWGQQKSPLCLIQPSPVRAATSARIIGSQPITPDPPAPCEQ